MEAVVRILWDGRFNARSSLGILSSELTDAVTTRHSVYGVAWPESEGALPPGVTRHRGETVDVAVRVCDPHSATLGLWRERAGRAQRSLLFLYFDGVRLDAAIAQTLGERCPDLLVFSRFTSAMLLAAGGRSRIEVVPLGAGLPDGIVPRYQRNMTSCSCTPGHPRTELRSTLKTLRTLKRASPRTSSMNSIVSER